ncbi:hypothetical protein KFK09_026163 [Dendrobium nobile]|uniref:Uncharacterized protein n=1 Tax=Dendrobium nobile TaxID=94219 RepID=A0A8T3A7J5_DENNO|nr:hypothetical protein KFK09_026163 [Dendrobium nobile]
METINIILQIFRGLSLNWVLQLYSPFGLDMELLVIYLAYKLQPVMWKLFYIKMPTYFDFLLCYQIATFLGRFLKKF